MECNIKLYNAGTGMDSFDRAAIVKFLYTHARDIPAHTAREAVDCVLKHTPSFGGFILADWHERQLRAVVMVNRTGMSGFGPENLITFAVVRKEEEFPLPILEQLIREAMNLADGEIAFHLPKRHPAIKVFQELGFQQDFVELRFSSRVQNNSA